MNRSRSHWWILYGTGSVLALFALGWISWFLIGLEGDKHAAESEAQRANEMRLALWRMDSWLGPQLAHEAARPYFDYLSFVPNDRAYTRLFNSIEPGEVLRPSPLLGFESDLFVLYFQNDDKGGWSSPQVPTGNQLDIAQGRLVSEKQLADKLKLFESFKEVIASDNVTSDLACVEIDFNRWIAQDDQTDEIQGQVDQGVQQRSTDNNAEFTNRLQKGIANQNMASQSYSSNLNEGRAQKGWQQVAMIEPSANWIDPGGPSEEKVSIGPLLPIWMGDEAVPGPFEIYYLRRVEIGERQVLQGFLCDWETLRLGLLDQISDLFPGAETKLVRGDLADEANAGELLAGIPARLLVSFPPMAAAGFWTPAKVTLGLAWFATVLALVGLGFSLHASILYGEKRSRFASSVTHELRTPLTTFRMYTEMLVDGMVSGEKREEYLQTLQKESDRLSILVENVLTYARLEDGRARLASEEVGVGDLLERGRSLFTKRAEDGGHRVTILNEAGTETRLKTDAGAVEQILFNLVDNACKYGHGPEPADIEVRAYEESGRVVLLVGDKGPGVPPRVEAAIFKAFDRGAVAPADPSPGIGLGLTLSRGLARDLGGELELLQADGSGARFALALPL
ncbi:MAG: HAMP domain-containing sensor histidine kinase [Planctomycetota bacterium]|nr:HAMP domain-containing sensor histidine kinase [Planctomycetota bacterium]